MAADVRDYGAVDTAFAAAFERFGPIDVVVSGAAGNFLAPAVGLSANAFRTVIEIDLIGTFNVLRASFDRLRKPGASLISITAGQAKRPLMFQAHASAAKAGINNLTETLAMEWGRSDEAQHKSFLRQIPARRIGQPDEVAGAVLFLAAPQASYVVSHALVVDGGYLLR